MDRQPDPAERDESLTQEEVNELRRNLSLLSGSGVLKFYHSTHQECAPGHGSVAISVRYVHPSNDTVLAAVEKLGGHNSGHTGNQQQNESKEEGQLTA